MAQVAAAPSGGGAALNCPLLMNISLEKLFSPAIMMYPHFLRRHFAGQPLRI
ncbi:hypothetical protein [Janthinobacterium sp.]|uniref:hypothetical protein n=1 Tax=Janthinobacterium sp. TaxID=1871054 RepID=UPI00293D84EE|nr:hypothetical protein [Janthinobacterium sp.]